MDSSKRVTFERPDGTAHVITLFSLQRDVAISTSLLSMVLGYAGGKMGSAEKAIEMALKISRVSCDDDTIIVQWVRRPRKDEVAAILTAAEDMRLVDRGVRRVLQVDDDMYPVGEGY